MTNKNWLVHYGVSHIDFAQCYVVCLTGILEIDVFLSYVTCGEVIMEISEKEDKYFLTF